MTLEGCWSEIANKFPFSLIYTAAKDFRKRVQVMRNSGPLTHWVAQGKASISLRRKEVLGGDSDAWLRLEKTGHTHGAAF